MKSESHIATAQGQPADTWTVELARGVRSRITSRHAETSSPVLSPDGNNVAYSAGNLLDTLFEKDALGAGEEKTLYTKAGEAMFPSDWSSDGRFLLYDTEGRPNTGADIWILPLEGEHKDPVLLLGTPSDEAAAAFSPDMHWIAYISNESGRFEAYVREFIASGPSGVPAVGDKRWQV